MKWKSVKIAGLLVIFTLVYFSYTDNKTLLTLQERRKNSINMPKLLRKQAQTTLQLISLDCNPLNNAHMQNGIKINFFNWITNFSTHEFNSLFCTFFYSNKVKHTATSKVCVFPFFCCIIVILRQPNIHFYLIK